jgi:hypothetical protein
MLRIQTGLLALALAAGALLPGGGSEASAQVYTPRAPWLGCVESPLAPDPTISVTCDTPGTGLIPPASHSYAQTDLVGGGVSMSVGQTAQHKATVETFAPGLYGVSLHSTPSEFIFCNYAIAWVDLNGDFVGDVLTEAILIVDGEAGPGGSLTTRVIAVSPTHTPGAFGTWDITVSVEYLGASLFNVYCEVTGDQEWALTATVPVSLGTNTIAGGGLVANNFAMLNAMGFPTSVSSGSAVGTFTDMSLHVPPPADPILLDPSGFVYESPDTGVRIPGAAATLERFNGFTWEPVHPVTDASVLDPDINPLFTDDDGLYKWDVIAGDYRVVVHKSGCTPATSASLTIPPPALDVNIGLTCGDADSDGLKDWRETNSLVFFDDANTGTSPADSDTDNDTVGDGAEVTAGTNPVDADSDDDGLNDGTEAMAGTDPLDADSDDDTIGDEPDNCPLASNTLQENTDRNFTDQTPPSTQDDHTWPNSDQPGDACDSDGDNDGRSDADEASGAGCGGQTSDPLLRDADGDRFLDGAECTLGTNPNDSGSKPLLTACGAAGDADGDRIQSRVEVCHYNTDPSDTDTDGDQDGSPTTGLARDGCEAASLNNDRVVNAADQLLLASAISTPFYLLSFDLQKDGAVNAGDQLVMSSLISPPGQCP